MRIPEPPAPHPRSDPPDQLTGEEQLVHRERLSHHERLWVPASWVLVSLAFVVSVVAICFFYLPSWMVVLVSVVAIAAAAALLLEQSAVLTVDEQGLRAGGARVEWEWVAGARVLTDEQTEAGLRGRADVRAYRLTRPYLRRQVRVELADHADPHPAWLLGSRRPEQLAAAIDSQLSRRPAVGR